MLALTRKVGQSIVFNDEIEITVVEVKGDQVRLGIKAPKQVKVLRKEIIDMVSSENKKAAHQKDISIGDLGDIMKQVGFEIDKNNK